MKKLWYIALKYFLVLLLLNGVSLAVTVGQSKLPLDFQSILQEVNLDVAIPVEGIFKERKARRQDFFNADYVLRSRKQKVEIQYLVVNASNHPNLVPHVHAMATLSNLARNEEAFSTIAIHDIEVQSLQNDFNADWGTVAFFQVKQSISKYKHGKLLSLFKQGRGMAYVLILFNEGNEQLANALSKAVMYN